MERLAHRDDPDGRGGRSDYQLVDRVDAGERLERFQLRRKANFDLGRYEVISTILKQRRVRRRIDGCLERRKPNQRNGASALDRFGYRLESHPGA